ncbi:MAG: GNAT family N-acetyltransferase [Reyranellaceae bacterium]
MAIRRAREEDIPELMRIRAAVRENVLSDPAKVPASLVLAFIRHSGIWLWDENGRALGFASADTRDGSLWALFVEPAAEGRGIGRALLPRALDDLRRAGWTQARLATQIGSRAETFYRSQGWREAGVSQAGERIFRLDL